MTGQHNDSGIRDFWTGRRVLVTGATGFIGEHQSRWLIEAGARVWAATHRDTGCGKVQSLSRDVTTLQLDMRDSESVAEVVARSEPEIIFHLAASGATDPYIDPLAALAVNVRGAIHILEALRSLTVQRIVLLGTSLEYGSRDAFEGLDPPNFYAASKVAAWAFARAYWRAYDLPVVVARLFQVYGPAQPAHTLVPAAMRAALAGEDFPMTPGEQERDFVFVEDVVEGLVAVAEAPGIEGMSLDLGTGVAHRVREVVQRIWELAHGTGRIRLGALPYRTGVVMKAVAGADRTEHFTGWRTTVSLYEGLRKSLQAFCS